MSWPSLSLAEAGVAVLDCEHRTPAAASGGHPYIAIPEIRDGVVHIDESRRITPSDLREWTRRTRPQIGDIVVTRRARVGDSAPIPVDDAAIGQNLVILRSSGSLVDQGFLRWAVRSPQWWDEVDRWRNVGAVFTSLNVRDIAKMSIPIPDIGEQRAIAGVLGALDDKIAANTSVAESSEALAGALYDQARQGVERVPASRVLAPVLGGTPARDNERYWSGGIPWVSAKDISCARSGVVIGTEETITDDGAANSRAKPVPAGSVIMTARGTVGAVARLGVAAAFNQSCYAFVPSAEIPSACLYFLVKDAAIDALSVSHGSVFSTITMRSFDALTVPSFSLESMRSLDGQISPLLDLVGGKVRESARLAELRDTLLPHLMSGRLSVRQAEAQVEAVL